MDIRGAGGQLMTAENKNKGTTPGTAPAEIASNEESLWTSSAAGNAVLPPLSRDVSSATLQRIRAAVKATEPETKRFEGHASTEALKRSCG
jgi:hypothetical protein